MLFCILFLACQKNKFSDFVTIPKNLTVKKGEIVQLKVFLKRPVTLKYSTIAAKVSTNNSNLLAIRNFNYEACNPNGEIFPIFHYATITFEALNVGETGLVVSTEMFVEDNLKEMSDFINVRIEATETK